MSTESSDLHVSRAMELLRRRTGFRIPAGLIHLLWRAMEAGARSGGFGSVAKLLDALEDEPLEGPEWRSLMARVAIGETYFFRDHHQMTALRTAVLPTLIESRSRERRLRVWSVGCASGEEPYTVAILLRELLLDEPDWELQLVGLDLNVEALERAREGLYRPWSFRRTDPSLVDRYFTREDGFLRIVPEIRDMVRFMRFNVADVAQRQGLTMPAPDLVLCRNMLMYLDPGVAWDVVRWLAGRLRPDGWFLVSAVELRYARIPGLHPVRLGQATIFKRCEGADGGGRATGERAETGPPGPRQSTRHVRSRPSSVGVSGAGRAPAAGRRATASRRSWRPVAVASPAPVGPVGETGAAEGVDTAVRLLLERRRSEAVGVLERCIAEGREEAAATSLLAQLAADAGRLGRAVELAQRAIELDPLNPGAYHVLGLVALDEGRSGEAASHLRRALYLEPRFAAAHLVLAAIARSKGQRDAAVRHEAMARRVLGESGADAVASHHVRLADEQLRRGGGVEVLSPGRMDGGGALRGAG